MAEAAVVDCEDVVVGRLGEDMVGGWAEALGYVACVLDGVSMGEGYVDIQETSVAAYSVI